MKSYSRIKIGVICSYLETGTRIISNFLYVPILLKSIGQSEYGLYQLIASIIAYLSVMESTLSAGTLKFYCKEKSAGNRKGMSEVLGTSQLVNIIVASVLLILSVIFSFLLGPIYSSSLTHSELSEARNMLILLGVVHAINMTSYVYLSAINGNEHFAYVKILNIISYIIQPIAVIFVVKNSPYAISVIWVQLIVTCVVAIARKLYSNKILKEFVHFKYFNKYLALKLLSFIGTIFLAVIADQIFWKADQLILGKLYSTGIVAVYAVGSQIFNIYMSVGTAFTSVFFPRLTLLVERNEKEKINNLFIKVGRLTFAICGAILGGFIICGREFLYLWAGKGFDEAYYIALLLMVPFTIDLTQSLGLSILQIYDKYMFRAKMYFIIAVINILLTVILAKLYGGIGAAVATSISIIIGTGFIMNIYYSRTIGLAITEFWKKLLKMIILFFVSVGATWIVSKQVSINGILGLLLDGSIFVMIYFTIIFKWGLNTDERQSLKHLLHI